MLWCFVSAALVMTALGLLALKFNPLSLLSLLQPARLIRGCIVLSCLVVALGLLGMAFVLMR